MPAAALFLSDGERETLERLARAQSVPHRQVLQARVLLSAADGVATKTQDDVVQASVLGLLSEQHLGDLSQILLKRMAAKAPGAASVA